MSPEEKAFWTAIKADPNDRLAQLVFADWLDENGQPRLAFAFRWAAARGRYPFVTQARKLACWSVVRKGQHRPVYSHQLPRLVYDRLRDGAIFDMHRQYANVMRAFHVLADTLAVIRDVIDPDGKTVK